MVFSYRRRLNEPEELYRSEIDFYYLSTQFFFWQLENEMRTPANPNPIDVTLTFTNRSKHILLGEYIDLGKLRERLDHWQRRQYTEWELTAIWERFGNDKPNGFLTPEYIEYLRTAPLPAYELEPMPGTPNGFRLEARGPASTVLAWESHWLPSITEDYGDALGRKLGVSWEDEFRDFEANTDEKVRLILLHDDFWVHQFGLRRQRSRAMSWYLDNRLINDIPKQLGGISNLYNALKLGYRESGTYPHAAPMICQALCGPTDEDILGSEMWFFDRWFATFGPARTTAVPDTYGRDSFYRRFGAKRAALCNSYKFDSGNPCVDMEVLCEQLRGWEVSQSNKVAVPTDALDIDKATALKYYGRHLGLKAVSNGIGTFWTNHTRTKAYGSIVAKPTFCNGMGLVKLTNNLNKASGRPQDIARMKRIHGYTNTDSAQLIV